MAYLIPVDEIIEVMMHGKGSRQASLISPLKSTYNDTLKLIPLDIEKAKEPKLAYEDIVWALINTKEFLFNH